ncbi:MAG: TlpA disulfide reductase family protein [Paracoccaceae bacterium]
MKSLLAAVLYTGFWLCANPATAADWSEIEALRQGDLNKLMFRSEPGEPVEAVLLGPDEAEHRLSDWRGKVVLLNFWATWCAPCRKEMPALDALQSELGGDEFAVLTVAVGRNPVPAITKFFDEAGVKTLPMLRDPRTEFARSMGVLGLPVSVILDREGREVARLSGDADWAGESARAVIWALMAR